VGRILQEGSRELEDNQEVSLLQQERKAARDAFYEKQERLRAQYVIEKAQTNNWNVIETLVTHMVSKKLIEELTGEVVLTERKTPVRENKEQKLREWARDNKDRVISPWEFSKEYEISYDTALKIIKENTPMYFVLIKKGSYTVRDGATEREEAKKAK